MPISLQERLESASQFRREGCNCATSVFLCFPDLTGMDRDTAVKATNALGSGIGASRELCGAAAAMAMLAGFNHEAVPSEKGKAAKQAGDCLKVFAAQNAGSLRCAQLKDRQLNGGTAPSCDQLVAQCVEIAHNNLSPTADS